MKLTFVGTGYVGLVTGTCFAELGNHVTCVDVNAQKISNLNQGLIPIYEPGLDDLVSRNFSEGRLQFTTDLAEAMEQSDVVFIGVGTPQREDGSANLDYVWSVIDEIRDKATSSKIVVVKSTVPVGTNAKIHERLNSDSAHPHSVASNPEFLREGLAVDDALNPDRVVIGTNDEFARRRLGELYSPFSDKGVPVLFMNWQSAEMTKYVANCVLATKISYINEMANMCEAVDADINHVRHGIGHDKRIGFQFFAPGVGYGGSCFPKDVRAMKAMAREHQRLMRILEAVDFVNEEQKRVAFQKLSDAFNGQLANVKVAIWGLAFKPETDDIREAPSLVLIRQLLAANASVTVFDPAASGNVERVIGDRIRYASDPYEAVSGASALVIMTEWKEFVEADLQQVKTAMDGNLVVDGRNIYDADEMAQFGFVYYSMGRSTTFPENWKSSRSELESARS